jgi:hypothetical protein
VPKSPFDASFPPAIDEIAEFLMASDPGTNLKYAVHFTTLGIFSRVCDVVRALDNVTIRGCTDSVLVHPYPSGSTAPSGAAHQRSSAMSIPFDSYCQLLVDAGTLVMLIGSSLVPANSGAESQAALAAAMQLLASPDVLGILVQKPMCRQMQLAVASGYRAAAQCRLAAHQAALTVHSLIRCGTAANALIRGQVCPSECTGIKHYIQYFSANTCN